MVSAFQPHSVATRPGPPNDDNNDFALYVVTSNSFLSFADLSCMARNPAQMGSKAGTRGLGFLQDIILIAAAVCLTTSTSIQRH